MPDSPKIDAYNTIPGELPKRKLEEIEKARKKASETAPNENVEGVDTVVFSRDGKEEPPATDQGGTVKLSPEAREMQKALDEQEKKDKK